VSPLLPLGFVFPFLLSRSRLAYNYPVFQVTLSHVCDKECLALAPSFRLMPREFGANLLARPFSWRSFCLRRRFQGFLTRPLPESLSPPSASRQFFGLAILSDGGGSRASLCAPSWSLFHLLRISRLQGCSRPLGESLSPPSLFSRLQGCSRPLGESLSPPSLVSRL